MKDTIIQDPENIKEAVQSLYKDRYKETESWRPDSRVHEAARVTDVKYAWLQRAFEEKEIVECLNMCAVEKASGPDGFPMVLYQTFWSMLKENVTNTIQYFHLNQVKCFNAMFIALIPKKPGASELNDFRPISLVGGVCKIIFRLLAERVKKVIHKLINRHQMTFINGRQIMKAAVIAVDVLILE